MRSGSDGVPPSELAARRSAPPTSTSAAAKPPPDLAAKSVAVLPFENMSPDKDNAFFADGVHEDVIISLGKIRDLRSSRGGWPFAKRRRAIQQEADELPRYYGADEPRRVGNQVRGSVGLIAHGREP